MGGLNIFTPFYSQWKNLPPLLYDFIQQGNLVNRPTLVFTNIDNKLIFPATTSTTFTIPPDIYTPTQLLNKLDSFISTSLSNWNLSASITSEHKIQFLLGGISVASPQPYVSRTIFAPVSPDLPPPFNLNPQYYNTYNLTTWGFNSVTQNISRSGGTLRGQQGLHIVNDIKVPQTLYVPYQTLNFSTGLVSSTFYAAVPRSATWVEGCLAVQPNVQLGLQREISMSTGGLVNVLPRDTLWTPASLVLMIGLAVTALALRANIYLNFFAVLCILLAVIALTRQSSESSELLSSPGIWTSDGHLIYTPLSLEQSVPDITFNLSRLLEKN